MADSPQETISVGGLYSREDQLQAQVNRWHRAFRHYYHDGADVCRQCGLLRNDEIHQNLNDGGTKGGGG